MSAQKLGRMKNAPLALVLAQVRYSPYLTIESRMPALQDALRHRYPAFRKGQIKSLEFTPTAVNVQTISRSEFSDIENRRGLLVHQDSIVFLATAYSDYEDFSKQLAEILECFERLVPDVLVEQLGLRYVDLIVPQENEEPEQYVDKGLHGFPLGRLIDSVATTQSQCIAKYDFDEGRGSLVARYTRGVSDPFSPDDLQPLMLAPPEIVIAAKAAQKTTTIAMLDWDRFTSHRAPFKADEIVQIFLRLHKDTSTAFKQAISDHAERIWNS